MYLQILSSLENKLAGLNSIDTYIRASETELYKGKKFPLDPVRKPALPGKGYLFIAVL